MMRFKLLVGIILFFTSSISFPATVNGKFTILQINNYQLTVKLQVNTNTGTDDLGGATIVFEFDTTAITFPGNPVNNVDYTFQNFNGGNYSTATITRPMINEIWVNIDLPFINNNNGTVVAAEPSWTDVVTINFNIVDTNGTASLTWLTTSPFWGIYDANNSTLWQTGQFENLFGPLPVELVYFNAFVSQNDVILEWKTASEKNNSGFEIQRTSPHPSPYQGEGGEAGRGWVVIGFVQGQGTSTEEKSYSFTDKDLETGNYLYKIIQVDFDGTKSESEVVNVEIGSQQTEYFLSQNYPNPFNPSTKIRYTIPQPLSLGERVSEGRVRAVLKVYDILGNEITTLVNEQKEPGIYEVEFNIGQDSSPAIASGIYIYQLLVLALQNKDGKTAEFIETKKMVLLR